MRTLLSSLFSSMIVYASAHADAPTGDSFTLESASFGSNTTLAEKHIYNRSGCRGGNVSPELHWKGAPKGTKSFAVTMFDPDAGGGAGWWHWLIFDIDAKTTSLPPGAGDPAGSNVPPASTSGTNSFGETGYGGPCPPRGDEPHRYVFTVYALKVERLGLPAGADGAAVVKTLKSATLLSTSVQGRYGR